MDLELSSKRAFVTGGSAGIGLAVARHLRTEGARVVVCGRDRERLEAATATLGGPPDAWGIQADVTDSKALAAAVEGAVEHMGGLDLVVANAGGAVGGDLLESTPEDWMATYALNVLHSAHSIRVAIPHLRRAGGGAVVIVASITGWKPGPRSSYATAKAAEIHLGAVLAQELGRYHIRVNTVSPGSTTFPGGGWESFGQRNPDLLAAFAHDEFPAGRLLDPDEVADAICFLLSARASGINGAHIAVDAGQGRPSARTFDRDAER
jgi:3-oxoacyl-[acyl-carrier protein] reductase